jgi:hypothetical protein
VFPNTGKVTVMRLAETQKKFGVYQWQETRIKERLKKSDKGGKFLSGDQVDKIVDSFKP